MFLQRRRRCSSIEASELHGFDAIASLSIFQDVAHTNRLSMPRSFYEPFYSNADLVLYLALNRDQSNPAGVQRAKFEYDDRT